MKSTIKMLLLAFAITFSSVMTANNEPTSKDPRSLTEEIQNLLKNPKFVLESDEFASVTLTFNRNSEIVVMSVDSESETVEYYIKNRLNYKKLDIGVDKINKTFIIPVKIQKK